MKNVINFLLLVCFISAVFLFASCKKTPEDLIVGTWKCSSVSLDPSVFTEAQRIIDVYSSSTFVFTKEKYLVTHIGNETGYGFYAINGDKLAFNINGREEAIMAHINQLDSKTLSFTYNEKAYDQDENGQGRYINVAVTLVFDKAKDARN